MKTYSVVIFALIIFLFVFHSRGEQEVFSRDVYKISLVLRSILSNYTMMEFDKILPFSEGKAKRDLENIIEDIKNPLRYEEVKKEINLLSDPKVKEIKIFEKENLALAVVEWNCKRSVPRGKGTETVDVKRETNYLFRKFGSEWKLVSYR
ncbi:MAG: hypothetical protein N2712_07255 [Brevinematales bacterium]|nr:hypothetical protein [Brevinematales bacterium]